MKLTEEQLRSAAILAREKELAQFNWAWEEDEHIFSEKFEAAMQDLRTQLAQGTLKAKPVRMGWQYYAKRGAAAVLVVFLLSCAAIPEAALAEYEKIVEMIETIETIFDEFTEYRFAPSEYEKKDFVAVKLEYLPEGMTEIGHRISNNENIYLRYENSEYYISLEQTRVDHEKEFAYIIDTKDANTQKVSTKNGEATIISKHSLYQFMLLHESNLLVGETNLPYEEMILFLEHISF